MSKPVVRRHLDNLTEYIPQIHDGLAGSVLYGTGRSAYYPDFSIYGKTGTCSETVRAWAGSPPMRATPNPNMSPSSAAWRAHDVWPARGGNRRTLLSRLDAKGASPAGQPRRFLLAI